MPPITANFIAPQGGGFEPQRAFDFWIEIYGIPGQETVTMSVVSGFFPAGSNAEIVVPFMAEDRKVAGRASFTGGTLTCVDHIDEGTMGSLNEWRKLVYDPATGKINRATQYKKQAHYKLLAPDGSSPRIWKLEGVWPTNLSGTAPSYSQNAYANVTCNLTFDRAQYLG